MSATTVAPPEAAAAAPPSPLPAAPDRAGATAPPLRWDGSARRLVAIGLGNLALAVLTLGLYRFWGTVRLRRHLWAHQEFLGGRLEYAGTGGELFRGFLRALLVILPALLLVSLVEPLLGPYPWAAWAFSGAKLAALTYFVGVAGQAARRYVASRTLWRGLRFALPGSPWRYGFVVSGWTALTLLTLGLAHPGAAAAHARWTVGRLRLGTAPFGFDGTARGLLRPWLLAWNLVAWSGLALWLLFGARLARSMVAALPPEAVAGDPTGAARAMIYAAVAALCALPAALVVWPAWSAAAMQWNARHTSLGGARFSMPGATGWAVFRLQAGNLLVSTFSLGLLHPVATARNAAFRARHLRLDRAPDLSEARQAERGPGTGEGAADLFGASAF
jgi:uncharacterized membrane protein YjgN (DUF898 family)